MSARADLIQKLMNKKRKAEVKVDQEVVVIEEKKIKQGEASTSKQEEDDEEKRKQEEEQKNKDLYNKVPRPVLAVHYITKFQAKEKVLFEAKRAKERADEHGPQGW